MNLIGAIHESTDGAPSDPGARSAPRNGAGDLPSGLRWLGRAELRRWALWISGLTGLAYLGVLIADTVLNPGRTPAFVTQGLTVLACAVAFGLTYRGRLEAGIVLPIFATWLELHASIPFEGVQGAALIVFPVVVLAAGLVLGGRAAFWMAGASTVTLAGTTVLAHVAWDLAGTDPRWEAYLLSVTVASMFVTAAMVQLGLRAFARATEAAREGERRVSDLIRHAPDGVLALDEAGRIQTANPAAQRLLGDEPLVGRRVDEVVRARAASPSKEVDTLLASGGQHEVTVELRTDGSHSAWAELAVTPLDAGQGGAARRITLRDVTQRRRAEEGERLLRDQLEHARRLEAMGRLAGGVAHDLNNLLTVVGVSAEMIRAEANPEADGETLALADDILAAQQRASGLIQDLLAFARKEVIRPEVLRPADFVSSLVPLLRHLLPSGIHLETRVDQGAEPVVADPEQLREVVWNLVTNARDAVQHEGTVTVGVSCAGAPRQWLGHDLEGAPSGFLEFWVADDGTGMDAATRARMFEPFFTTRPRGQGTGLGLSVVDGVVSQNGGSVDVETWPGGGTVVRVFWPVAGEAP